MLRLPERDRLTQAHGKRRKEVCEYVGVSLQGTLLGPVFLEGAPFFVFVQRNIHKENHNCEGPPKQDTPMLRLL